MTPETPGTHLPPDPLTGLRTNHTGSTPPRAIGYIRVSTTQQADDPDNASMMTQRARIEAECERRGWVLERVACDAGQSGGSLRKRPELAGALADLKAKRACVLVAAELSRLSRSVADLTHMLDRAESEGWKVAVLDVGVDTSTPSGRMIAQILGAIAEWERQIIRARTREGMARKKAEGVKFGRPPGFGRPRRISDDAIRRVHDLHDEGLTLREIGARLEAAGVPTATGGRWHPATVKRVLAYSLA